MDALCDSVEALDGTAQRLAALVQARGAGTTDVQPPCASKVAQHSNNDRCGGCDTSAVLSPATPPPALYGVVRSSCVHAACCTRSEVGELQSQLAALTAEKARIEADRQDMAAQQGEYRGAVARLEGALAFSERKLRDKAVALEELQAKVEALNAELQAAHGAATQTPDRCRIVARELQEEADRCVRVPAWWVH